MAFKRHRQPEGSPTRGKTAPNRLRRVDTFLAWALRPWIHRPGPPVVDLGYGRVPRTTLELAERLRRGHPTLEVVGVEIDPERVAAAQPFSDSRTRFVRGGFDFELPPARLIRAMNVLRQYPESAVAEAHALLAERLVEGGWLVEGTSDPLGRTLVVELHQKHGDRLEDRGLLFSTNFREPHGPRDFQPVLPKRLIHRVVPGEPVAAFLAAWERCWVATPPSFGARYRFAQTARALAGDYRVDRRRWLIRKGYLWWRR